MHAQKIANARRFGWSDFPIQYMALLMGQ